MDPIDRIRAFNRLYLQKMGLFDRQYLDSGQTLTEVRLLYELAHHPGQSARELSRRLGLDEGYLSRLIGAFQRRGWIERRPDPADARRRVLMLTDAGAAVHAPREEASRQDIAERAGAPERAAALADALDAAGSLIDGTVPELRDLAPGDAGWVISEHARLYARDEGYDASFEGLVAGILSRFIETRDPERERGWIAAAGPRRLGSIFCMAAEPGVAQLRLFLLLPEARGLGLGQRLHDACLSFAREAGYRRIRLWTHESHRAAVQLYSRNGWTMLRAEPGRAFGQDVVDQFWERAL